MKYLITLIIISISFAFDPSLYLSYHTPKNLLLIFLIPFCLLIFWMYQLIKTKEYNLSFSIIEIILLTRLIWLIITNPKFLTHSSNLAFWILLSFILLTFLTRQVFLSSTKEKNFFIILFRSIWIIGLVQTFIGFYQFYFFNNVPNQFIKTPIIGLIGSANGYGIFLSVCIISALIDFLIQEERRQKAIILFFILLLFFSLILNGSRGALFALICSIFITSLLFYFNNSAKKLKVFRFFPSKIITSTFFILIIIGFGIWLAKLNSESTKGRLMIWEISAPMFVEHPIFGVGQNRYAMKYLNYQANYFRNKSNLDYAYKAANLKQAHNEFIQAFCESGIIGGIIFLIICVYPLWLLFNEIIKDRSEYKIFYTGLFAILSIILIHSLVDSPLHVLPVSVIFYAVLGLVPAKICKIKLYKVFQFSLIFIIFVYAIFIGNKTIQQYSGYKYWQRGVESTQKYLWKDAIENYKHALENLPEKGELEFHLGSAMVMNQNYNKGIIFLKNSLNNFNDRNIYLSLSYAYLRLNKYNLAEKYSKIALSMFPDHLAPHLLLGEIYYRLGEIKKSKSSLIKCIAMETNVKSFDVYKISNDAKALWKRFYGD